ncbi:hypothetical protein OPU71_18580 [Niveibacterium sp. 24ML]|nr:hypothetical protein [Niveibacterium sp. 24ML]MCX9158133.1 hypothetical protein [Niveibacterium sp. 24ML]
MRYYTQLIASATGVTDALVRWRQKLEGLADDAAITPWISPPKVSA